MAERLKKLKSLMSLKLHFMDSHVQYFPGNIGNNRNCGFGMTGSHDTDIDIYRYLCEASNLRALHYRPRGLKVPDCPAALGVYSTAHAH